MHIRKYICSLVVISFFSVALAEYADPSVITFHTVHTPLILPGAVNQHCGPMSLYFGTHMELLLKTHNLSHSFKNDAHVMKVLTNKLSVDDKGSQQTYAQLLALHNECAPMLYGDLTIPYSMHYSMYCPPLYSLEKDQKGKSLDLGNLQVHPSGKFTVDTGGLYSAVKHLATTQLNFMSKDINQRFVVMMTMKNPSGAKEHILGMMRDKYGSLEVNQARLKKMLLANLNKNGHLSFLLRPKGYAHCFYLLMIRTFDGNVSCFVMDPTHTVGNNLILMKRCIDSVKNLLFLSADSTRIH